jgi:geranylgeranyl diphosphate synthase type I
MNLSDAFATYLPLIEAEMRAMLAPSDPILAGHYGIMQYHIGWLDADLRPADAFAGKRIRPLLCLLVCAAAGGDPQMAVPAAAGLELLHNFSLLHDDIEDNSPMRRHRATAWTIWGMPQACNAGDGMFSLAHLVFFRLLDRGVPPQTVLEALRIFDETCVALTEGQYLDISFEQRLDTTPADYCRMISGKTGALLAVASQIGALIAVSQPRNPKGFRGRFSGQAFGSPLVDAYRRYGAAVGHAFQLQDDILGIWGDEAATGKSAASDILSKKKSLPVVYALSHPAVGAELRSLYAGPAFTPADVPAVLALLDAAGAREYTAGQMHEATRQAHEALQAAAPYAAPEAHRLLGDLVDMLVDRTA